VDGNYVVCLRGIDAFDRIIDNRDLCRHGLDNVILRIRTQLNLIQTSMNHKNAQRQT